MGIQPDSRAFGSGASLQQPRVVGFADQLIELSRRGALDLQYRPQGTQWPAPWRAQLRAPDGSPVLPTAYGATGLEALHRLAGLVEEREERAWNAAKVSNAAALPPPPPLPASFVGVVATRMRYTDIPVSLDLFDGVMELFDGVQWAAWATWDVTNHAWRMTAVQPQDRRAARSRETVP